MDYNVYTGKSKLKDLYSDAGLILMKFYESFTSMDLPKNSIIDTFASFSLGMWVKDNNGKEFCYEIAFLYFVESTYIIGGKYHGSNNFMQYIDECDIVTEDKVTDLIINGMNSCGLELLGIAECEYAFLDYEEQ